MSYLSEALERYIEVNPRLADDLVELVGSQDLANAMRSGRHRASLYEATLLAAYCKASVREFAEPSSTDRSSYI